MQLQNIMMRLKQDVPFKHADLFIHKKSQMAQQIGIIPLQGTIDNITFYKTKDGYIARKKGGIPASRISQDPSFQRTRENMAEFGKAGKAGKLLRTALRPLLKNIADKRLIARLSKEMVKVIKADAVNPRGFRNVIDGEAELLKGFEFNENSKLGTTFFVAFTSTINRISGEMTINLPPFKPTDGVAAPAGATHFKIISAGVEIDFEKSTYVVASSASADLLWNTEETSIISLLNTVTPNSTHPLFLALGIEFFQLVNGINYPLSNGAFNTLSMINVSGE
jgi:hypothetical protein